MARRKKKPSRSKSSLKIVNPAASSVPTSTPMPYSSVPFTTSPGLPVQPLTTPRLRQIVESESVRIINPKAL